MGWSQGRSGSRQGRHSPARWGVRQRCNPRTPCRDQPVRAIAPAAPARPEDTSFPVDFPSLIDPSSRAGRVVSCFARRRPADPARGLPGLLRSPGLSFRLSPVGAKRVGGRWGLPRSGAPSPRPLGGRQPPESAAEAPSGSKLHAPGSALSQRGSGRRASAAAGAGRAAPPGEKISPARLTGR